MLTHDEMVGLQAEKHDLIQTSSFGSAEHFVLHLMHTRAYLEAAKLAKDKNVLDVGCNTGYGSEILSRSARRVVGVDVSEKAIATAGKQYGDRGIQFQLVDGKQLPFNDGQFEIITSFQVIEHVVDYEVYVGELKRVLAPAGFVLFTTPNSLLRLDPGMKPWNPFHVREFSASQLKSLLKTFFSQVQVYGLFANEPLYTIEAKRLNQERENARRRANGQAQPTGRSARQLIKGLVPEPLLRQFRRLKTAWSTPAELQQLMKQHGVEDLFYRASELEHALDLLAVCSEDERWMPNLHCNN